MLCTHDVRTKLFRIVQLHSYIVIVRVQRVVARMYRALTLNFKVKGIATGWPSFSTKDGRRLTAERYAH